jgi:hypothetical protein
MAIEQLWEDPAVQRLMVSQGKQRLEFTDFAFFMPRLADILQARFVPTVEDIVKYRKSTFGCVSDMLEVNENNWVLHDICGKRYYRRRWLDIFKEIKENQNDGTRRILVYFVSLIGYSEVLWEDWDVSQLEDAIEILKYISQNDWISLGSIDFYLMFSKEDLLKERIRTVPIRRRYPSYSGANEVDCFKQFIQAEFQRLTPVKINALFVDNWDPDSVRHVFQQIIG